MPGYINININIKWLSFQEKQKQQLFVQVPQPAYVHV